METAIDGFQGRDMSANDRVMATAKHYAGDGDTRYNAAAAGLSRRITWRGISYELKSPTETSILGRVDSG